MFKTQKGDFCMKKKTILSFAVALTLGLGVAVGLHANEAKAVSAANATVYLKPGVWAADNPRYEIWNWSNNNDGATLVMTESTTDPGVYKATFDSAKTNMIFKRMKPSSAVGSWNDDDVWNRTGDITFNATHPCLEVVDWNTAKWTAYTEPVTYSVDVYVDDVKRGTETVAEGKLPAAPSITFGQKFSGWYSDAALTEGNEVTAITQNTTVYGKVETAEKITYTIDDSKVQYSTLNVYEFIGTQGKSEWPGDPVTNKTISVFENSKFIINDGTKQTVDIEQSLVPNDTLKILAKTDESGHNEVVWASNEDIPESDGYYLVGDYTNWKFKNAVKLTTVDSDDNFAVLENYTVTEGQKYKVRSYLNDVEEWWGIYNETTHEEDDYVADSTKAVNFYASKDGHLYVANYVPPVVVYEYKYSLNGAEPVAMLEHDDDEVKSASIAFKAGDELVFTKNNAAYDVEPKDDDAYTNVKKDENKLIFTQDYEGELYLNFVENKLWAGRLQAGLYLLGVDGNWNVKEGIHAVPEEKEQPAYYVYNLELTAESKIKMIRIPDEGKEVTYFDAIEYQVSTETEVAYSIDEDKNLVVSNAGTYDIFCNPSSGWYGIDDKNYVPDVPSDGNGYYLVGDFTNWKFEGAVKLGAGSDTDYAILENYTVTKDQKYKVKSYFDGAIEWWGIYNQEAEREENYVADATKAVTFYAGKDGYLYVADYIASYTLTIGGKEVELTPAEGNEYSAKGVVLKAGDKVTGLKAGASAVEGYTSKKVGNNNLLEDLTVIANATADIYYDKNTKEIFISGLPEGGFHIITGSGDVIQMTPAGEFEGFIQYKSEMITFAKDEVIQFLDTNGEYGVRYATIFKVNKVNQEGLGKNFEATEAGIVCKTACDARVYLKLKQNLDEIYFGEVEEYIQQAKNFADDFKTMMAQACSETEKQEAVEAKWDQAAADFSGLSPEAQAELRSGSDSSVAEVREFAERYLAIASQHPDWDLENFLGVEIPASSAVYSNIEFSEENNSLMIMIVVISAATIAGASVLLILKKKRHSK